MFQRYESLPKTVYAVQFTDENKDMVFNELTGNRDAHFEDGKPVLKITTAHGDTAIVRVSDWIVRDVEPGTYYPVKDEVKNVSYV